MLRDRNVDNAATLSGILDALETIGSELPLLFPAHPLEALSRPLEHIRLLEPVAHLEMVALLEKSAVILTDSGGLQEESTALGVPRLTLRSTTERPSD